MTFCCVCGLCATHAAFTEPAKHGSQIIMLRHVLLQQIAMLFSSQNYFATPQQTAPSENTFSRHSRFLFRPGLQIQSKRGFDSDTRYNAPRDSFRRWRHRTVTC